MMASVQNHRLGARRNRAACSDTYAGDGFLLGKRDSKTDSQ